MNDKPSLAVQLDAARRGHTLPVQSGNKAEQRKQQGRITRLTHAVKMEKLAKQPRPDLTDSGPYATKDDDMTAFALNISVTDLRSQRAAEDRA